MSKRLGARVILVGGLPEPSGGVTVYLGRLVHALGDDIDFSILDINPGKKLPNKSVSHRTLPQGRLARLLSIIWFVHWISADVVHFHYSRPASILSLLAFALISKKIHVTLHNGALQKRFASLPPIFQRLVRIAARRMYRAYAISPEQFSFYKDIGLPETRIVKAKSHFPPNCPPPRVVDDKHKEVLEKFEHTLIVSGHVDRDYNYEFLVRYLNDHSNACGIMFVYGLHMDHSYLDELRNAVHRKEQLVIYMHRDEQSFLAALQMSSVYLRPNFVDSWGVAVADATILGIPAIASDVCERYPGAILFNSGSYENFSHKVTKALNGDFTDNTRKPVLDFREKLCRSYLE